MGQELGTRGLAHLGWAEVSDPHLGGNPHRLCCHLHSMVNTNANAGASLMAPPVPSLPPPPLHCLSSLSIPSSYSCEGSMALSSSRSRGRGSSSQGSCQATIGAPPADDTHLAVKPSINPELVAMLIEELVAHLNRHYCTTDFANAVLVFVTRVYRLAEAEELVHACYECMDML